MDSFDASRDPVRSWKKAGKQKLKLDLSLGSLNGLRLNEPMAYLGKRGKPDNENAGEKGFFYKKSGLIVRVEKNGRYGRQRQWRATRPQGA